MLPSPAEAVARYLAVCRALLFVKEEPKGSNSGTGVEAFQKCTGNKAGDAWCASFVAYAGVSAFGSDWPLPKTASCQALFEYGKSHGLLVDDPQPGDLILLWFPSLGRYAHVAVVNQTLDANGKVGTFEGNTTTDGSREGWQTMMRTRTKKANDVFLRWAR